MPETTFQEAILKAQRKALSDPSVILMGEGVPDPKCIFGTTKGLKEEFPNQVFDQPVSEAGVTGILIGAALNGLKPIMTHQRMDFSLYAMDQIVNNAAKWYSMFGGQRSVPLTIRMIIGRGWGQGNQHSQNLSALYAHIPGLKVMMPSNPLDAEIMFEEAVNDPNPVIFIENKWLYNCKEKVWPRRDQGAELTIVSWGYAIHEVKRALDSMRVKVDLIDLKHLKPIYWEPILDSISKTGRLLVVEDAWRTGSLSAEIVATCVEAVPLDDVVRITYPDFPSPSTHALAKHYYKTAEDIAEAITHMVDDYEIISNIELPHHDVDPFLRQYTSAL